MICFAVLYFNPCYVNLLTSQSTFSGTREITSRYQKIRMNFEILRVDCVRNELI